MTAKVMNGVGNYFCRRADVDNENGLCFSNIRRTLYISIVKSSRAISDKTAYSIGFHY